METCNCNLKVAYWDSVTTVLVIEIQYLHHKKSGTPWVAEIACQIDSKLISSGQYSISVMV
eukprot:72035-Amphidinium_carterae.1